MIHLGTPDHLASSEPKLLTFVYVVAYHTDDPTMVSFLSTQVSATDVREAKIIGFSWLESTHDIKSMTLVNDYVHLVRHPKEQPMNLKLNQAVMYKSGLTGSWLHGTVERINPRRSGATGYYIGGWHFSTEPSPDEIANDGYSSYPMNWVRLPILKSSLVKE